jgi:cell wall-associated NlpC family hydrolase
MPGTSHVLARRAGAALRAPRLRSLRALALALLVGPMTLMSVPASADVFGDSPPGGGPVTSTGEVHSASRVVAALHVAERQIGDPYSYGAAGPDAFDCSGLVYYATHQAGFSGVPRTSSAQSQFMRHISRDQMQRGDFVFFTGSGGVYHVAIYLGMQGGRRMILHAPYGGTTVRRDPIWTDSWFPGTLRGV